MERYNIFNNIHKALKALMYDTALSLQRADFSNQEEAENAIDKLFTTLAIFDEHAQHEDKFLLNTLKKYDQGIASMFESEHITDLGLAAKLKYLADGFFLLSTTIDRIKTGPHIDLAYVEFLAFNLKHMARQEEILNDLLWRNFSDEQIHLIGARIVENVSPQINHVSSLWMLRGMNVNDISNWLKQVNRNETSELFNTLLATAENEMETERYNRLVASLSEAVMIA